MTGALDDRTAVIAGVGRPGQVGEAVAGAFVRAGARVVLIDRDLADASARARELGALGGQALAFAGDLSDVAAVDALAATIGDVAPNGVPHWSVSPEFCVSGPVARATCIFHTMLTSPHDGLPNDTAPAAAVRAPAGASSISARQLCSRAAQARAWPRTRRQRPASRRSCAPWRTRKHRTAYAPMRSHQPPFAPRAMSRPWAAPHDSSSANRSRTSRSTCAPMPHRP